MANRCHVLELIEENGRADGVRGCADQPGGRDFRDPRRQRRQRHRAGPTRFAGGGRDAAGIPRIRPSRGTTSTLAYEKPADHRGGITRWAAASSIFALPWLGCMLVGAPPTTTTRASYDVPADDVDVDYLQRAPVLRARPRACGPDPRLRLCWPPTPTGDSKKLPTPRAELFETRSGLVTITGGKLTTWRRMAKLAVDRIVEREGREAPCRTA